MGTMGFANKEQKVVKLPIIEENFTNAICFGKTGTGKTTGYILPNIENRIKLGHGILVYDFKGTLHEHVKVLANRYGKLEDVVEVGKPWSKKINILKYTNNKIVRQMYQNAAGEHSDSYWQNASSNLLGSIYTIFSNLSIVTKEAHSLALKVNALEYPQLHYTLNMKNIFEVVRSATELSDFLEYTVHRDILKVKDFLSKWATKSKITNDNSYKTSLKKIAYHNNKANDALNSLSEYKGVSKDVNEVSGKFGVLGVLNSTLSHFALKDFINEDQLDIVKSLNEGKIVILNLGDIDEAVLSLLNISIYQRLQRRVIDNSSITPVSIFVDEAQKILNANYLPEVDVCRESKFEYILSTQDELLLYSKIGKLKTLELMRNLVEQYSFASNDELNETENLKEHQYKNLITKKTNYTQPIFIDKKERFDVEYSYQHIHHIFDMVEVNQKRKFILLYLPELYELGEVSIQYQDYKSEIVPIVNYADNLLDEYYSKAYEDIIEDKYFNDEKNFDKTIGFNITDNHPLEEKVDLILKRISEIEKKSYNYGTAALTCIKKTEQVEKKMEKLQKDIEKYKSIYGKL